jgi:hypothetical protein
MAMTLARGGADRQRGHRPELVCSGVVTVLVTVMTSHCASSYGQSLTGLGSRSHQWGPHLVARQHPS